MLATGADGIAPALQNYVPKMSPKALTNRQKRAIMMVLGDGPTERGVQHEPL